MKLLPAGAGTVTNNVTLAEWFRAALVPVIVRGKLPTGVVNPVETVIVVDPEPVTVEGVKLALAPAGRPVALKLTVALNPSMGVTVT